MEEGQVKGVSFEEVGLRFWSSSYYHARHVLISKRKVTGQLSGNREVSKPHPTQCGNASHQDAFLPRGMPRKPNAHSSLGAKVKVIHCTKLLGPPIHIDPLTGFRLQTRRACPDAASVNRVVLT